ncbi:MAG: GH92 family glycosyl hydrolase [Bacteroidales bacterium]|nr:GH92 family glycosyl hydrolase [Bacteroidales bacterium]MCI1785641.1 GH92 family glycosyl hydrolase [Bacteroidales bacterium]
MIGLCSCAFGQQKQHGSYIDPFIGTDGMGHTFPGACVPFGSVQLSPDTDTIPYNVNGKYQPEVYEYCAGYRYSDPTIVGFSHTHLSGTGHSDLGDILIMPGTGSIKLNPGTSDKPETGYRSRYSHATEKASAGYYAVTLDDYGIKVQLTATERVGVHKYTFPKGKNGHIIIDLNHGIYNYDGKTLWAEMRVINDTLLTGYRITDGWARTNYTYFAISLSRPIIDYGYKDLKKPAYKGGWAKFPQYHNFPEMAGRKVVAWMKFETAENPELVIKVALSASGTENAIENLKAEASGKSFDTIASEAAQAWEKEIADIDVEGTEDQKKMFYTSLYHTMINPSVYMDVDGSYRGLDHSVHKSDGFTNYTVFSLWDTYRAEHPLLTLLKPDRERDMVISMLKHYEQSAEKMLPIWSLKGNETWCMTGYHAVAVIADAITKGLDIDKKEALKAMVSTSNVSWYGGLGQYVKLGYVPLDKNSTAASNTLEYSYDDWTIWHTALISGDSETAGRYLPRALYYRNIFDPALGFARPRYSDGSFKKNFDIKQTMGEGFIEGNSLNYSFHAPQDVFGLMKLMGGDKAFISKLDELFGMDLPEYCYADNEDITKDCLIGGYVHGNEPSHHIIYLYDWTSQPWKTQYWLREVLNRMYRPEIRGLGGNDDCGQMSAWYIFSVLGFYPVCPGTNQYVLGAPYLPYARIKLPDGNIFEIKAPGVSDKNRYVKKVLLNGKPYDKLYITHKEILQGGTLEFEMGASPNKRRGLKPSDKPYSLTDKNGNYVTK